MNINNIYIYILSFLLLCRYVNGGMGVRTCKGSFTTFCVLHVSRARGTDAPLRRSPYGKIPRRGNNHPCVKLTRLADAGVPAALRPERPVSAPRKADRPHSPTPKRSPLEATTARPTKSGHGSSPGGSRKRGAGRRQRVEQSLFFLGKSLA